MNQPALFTLPTAQPSHPAEYTEALYPTMARMLAGYLYILDPMAGVGGVQHLKTWLRRAYIFGNEIQYKWARQARGMVNGNALHLPFPDDCFDAICNSPVYGNRMADTLIDGYERITYTAKHGSKLHPDNAGAMQWGNKYKVFHLSAWEEARRVLRLEGGFVLNIKDHYRAGERQYVTEWHIITLSQLGFELVEEKQIACPGSRYGANGDLRMPYESVIKFVLRHKPRPAGTGTRLVKE